MAEIKTIDITSMIGSDRFPLNENDVLGIVETIAVQNIRALDSSNRIEDGLYEYDVENGKVIEEAVIEMAEPYAFDKNAYSRVAKDPSLYVKYFNNWEAVQFHTTTRKNDIRKVIANKGIGVEGVVAEIIDSLTKGEGWYDFKQGRQLLFNAPAVNYNTILGGGGKVPSTMKGVIYALRDAYNHLKSTNSDCTSVAYDCATPEEYIRLLIPTKVLNLMGVVELANVFNLEKEELFGKLVVIDVDDLDPEFWYKCLVYDKRAMGKGKRLYEYSQEIVAKGLYNNHYLTTEKCFFFNGLFKAVQLDCRYACITAEAELIETPTSYTITNTLTNCASDNDAVSGYQYSQYIAEITPEEGYVIDENSSVEVLMGGVDITEEAWDVETHSILIPQLTGNVAITITADSE